MPVPAVLTRLWSQATRSTTLIRRVAVVTGLLVACGTVWSLCSGPSDAESLTDDDLDSSFELLISNDSTASGPDESGHGSGTDAFLNAGAGLDLTVPTFGTQANATGEPLLLADSNSATMSEADGLLDFHQASVAHGPLFSDPLVVPQTPGVPDAANDSAQPLDQPVRPARYERSRVAGRPSGAPAWFTGGIEFD